jgi:ribosomal protein L37AE/L43A
MASSYNLVVLLGYGTKTMKQGFYCTACNRTYSVRPVDGVCPDCPHEPVYDLSDVQARGLAYAEEQKEAEQVAHKTSTIALVLASIVAVVVAGILFYTFDGDPENEAHVMVALIAGGLSAAVMFKNSWWLLRKLWPAGSNLPDLERQQVSQCVSCGSTALQEVGKDAYRCQTCDYEGGAGWVEVRRAQVARELGDLSEDERRVVVQNQLARAAKELDTILLLLQGPLEDFRPTDCRPDDDEYRKPLSLREGLMMKIGPMLVAAQQILQLHRDPNDPQSDPGTLHTKLESIMSDPPTPEQVSRVSQHLKELRRNVLGRIL